MKVCMDCPRACGVQRPLSRENGVALPGFCRSPRLPVLARAGLHMWEEPVISGEKGSGTVFFSSCNLHCVFCQNYNISTMRQGKQVTVGRLKEIYHELIAQGANNINLVTPGHYSDAILESLAEPLPVPVVYNTNGYDSVETLRKFEGKVQIYLPDLKYMDNRLAARYSGANDYVERATEAIREMFRQTGPFEFDDNGMLRKGVVIRHLILPGCVENSLKVIRFVEENFAPDEVIFSLMRQYIPCGRVSAEEYPELNRKVTQEEYDAVEDALFNSTIEAGFVQDDESASEEFIPAFDGTGV